MADCSIRHDRLGLPNLAAEPGLLSVPSGLHGTACQRTIMSRFGVDAGCISTLKTTPCVLVSLSAVIVIIITVAAVAASCVTIYAVFPFVSTFPFSFHYLPPFLSTFSIFFPLSMPFSRFFPLFPFLSIMPFVTEHIAVCVVGHVKCMGGPARRSLASPDRVWLCYACKPCTVCLVSGRTRKLRLVNTHSATRPRAVL